MGDCETDMEGPESYDHPPAKRRRLVSTRSCSLLDTHDAPTCSEETQMAPSLSPKLTPPSLCASQCPASGNQARHRLSGFGLASDNSLADTDPPVPIDDVAPVLKLESGERDADTGQASNESGYTDLKEQEQTVYSCMPGAREVQTAAHITDSPQNCILHAKQGAENANFDDNLKLPGPSITPPLPLRSPLEYVYTDVVNPDFGEDVQRAYRISLFREGFRRNKYGASVTERWKRGSTPEEVRAEWRATAARQKAQAEEYSSDSD